MRGELNAAMRHHLIQLLGKGWERWRIFLTERAQAKSLMAIAIAVSERVTLHKVWQCLRKHASETRDESYRMKQARDASRKASLQKAYKRWRALHVSKSNAILTYSDYMNKRLRDILIRWRRWSVTVGGVAGSTRLLAAQEEGKQTMTWLEKQALECCKLWRRSIKESKAMEIGVGCWGSIRLRFSLLHWRRVKESKVYSETTVLFSDYSWKEKKSKQAIRLWTTYIVNRYLKKSTMAGASLTYAKAAARRALQHWRALTKETARWRGLAEGGNLSRLKRELARCYAFWKDWVLGERAMREKMEFISLHHSRDLLSDAISRLRSDMLTQSKVRSGVDSALSYRKGTSIVEALSLWRMLNIELKKSPCLERSLSLWRGFELSRAYKAWKGVLRCGIVALINRQMALSLSKRHQGACDLKRLRSISSYLMIGGDVSGPFRWWQPNPNPNPNPNWMCQVHSDGGKL